MNTRHDQLLRTILVLASVLLIPSANALPVEADASSAAGLAAASHDRRLYAAITVEAGEYGGASFATSDGPTVWALQRGSGTLLAYPYLGETTPTSVVVSWATDNPGASEVRYGLDASYTNLAAATSSTYDGKYWHSATIAGLAADTAYRYKVYTGGYDVTPWPEITFTTAPEPAASQLTFVVLGDSRPYGESLPPSQGALNVAAQLDQQSFDLALHTGDMVYAGGVCSGDNSSWNQYIRAYLGLYRQSIGHTPFYPSLGNHETNGGSCGYTSYTNVYDLPKNAPAGDQEEYYSFDWGNAHFVALDTNQDYGAGSAQYNWLVNDLQTSTRPWKLVFFHTPAYSSGAHGSTIAVQTQLVPLMEIYGVDVVFSGHDHHYERTCPILDSACTTSQAGGVTYYVTGGGGAPLRSASGGWFTAHSDSLYHFIKAQIDNCWLRLDAMDADGRVFDSYEIDHCHTLYMPFVARHSVSALALAVESITAASIPGYPAVTPPAVRSSPTLLDLNRRQQ